MKGSSLRVDTGELRSAADTVHGWSRELDVCAGAGLVSSLHAAETAMPGARCEGVIPELTAAIGEIMGDLLAAVDGVCTGLVRAAEFYEEIEDAATVAAGRL